MIFRNLESRIIPLLVLMLTLAGWPLVGIWSSQIIDSSALAFRALYTALIAGWAGSIIWLAIAQRRGAIGLWLSTTGNIRQNKTILWLAVAGLWLIGWAVVRIGAATISAGATLLLGVGLGFACIAGSALILSLAAPRDISILPSQKSTQPQPDTRWHLMFSVVAGLFVIMWAIIVVGRLTYPFELEWMEGGSLLQMHRLVEGQDLFVAPSIDFVPLIYTPLYYYFAAGLAQIIGVSFIPLRLISIAASVASMFMIFWVVRRETGRPFYGWIATGLFAAVYPLSASWYDVGRVDSLAVFWLLAAIYVLRFEKSLRGAAFAGILLAAAFLTKQTMLIASLPLLLYGLFTNWRHGTVMLAVTASLIAGICFWLNAASDGWFAYYIFGLPAGHDITYSMVYGFWIADIWLPLAVVLVLAISNLPLPSAVNWQEIRLWLRNGDWFFLAVLGGTIGVAWLGKLNEGGFNNVLIPVHATLAIAFSLGLYRLENFITKLATGEYQLATGVIGMVCVIQFLSLSYNPVAHFPTSKDFEAGNRILGIIREIDGDVLIIHHNYLAMMAGKESFIHGMALSELAGGFGGQASPEANIIIEELKRAIRDQRFAAIIIDSSSGAQEMPPQYALQPLIEMYYRRESLLQDNDVFWPITGTRSRPDEIYYPKELSSQ